MHFQLIIALFKVYDSLKNLSTGLTYLFLMQIYGMFSSFICYLQIICHRYCEIYYCQSKALFYTDVT